MIFFIWIALAFAVGMIAGRRFDRNAIGWFVLAILISPLLAIIFLFAAGRKPPPPPEAIDWTRINWSGETHAAKRRQSILDQTNPRHTPAALPKKTPKPHWTTWLWNV